MDQIPQMALTFGVSAVISWVLLLIVIPIAQKLADFSMPPWSEILWKLAVVSLTVNAVAVLLDPVNWLISWIAGGAALWALLARWFDADLFGVIIVVFVTWILRVYLTGVITIALTA